MPTSKTARGRQYFLLDPGLIGDWFGGLDQTYIPESAIAGYTDEGVYLNLAKGHLRIQSWEAPRDLSSYRKV